VDGWAEGELRGTFEKFVDSPYYSESELCGGAITVSFSNATLASDAVLATLHPLLENVLQTVDHFEISCLGAAFSWLEKPRNRMGRDVDCMEDVLMRFHRYTFSKPDTEFNSDDDSRQGTVVQCQDSALARRKQSSVTIRTLKVALVSLLTYMFLRQPCCYY
jgi:hypothetical protein